jgi:hypothetical protein
MVVDEQLAAVAKRDRVDAGAGIREIRESEWRPGASLIG